MNLFKSFELKWWQAAIFKICLLSLGLIIGVSFKDTFISYLAFFWVLTLIAGVYILTVWWKQ